MKMDREERSVNKILRDKGTERGFRYKMEHSVLRAKKAKCVSN